MKRLSWPGLLLLSLTACDSATTLQGVDAGSSTGGAGSSTGGAGGAIRGRNDGSIIDPGTGGSGTGGSSGGTGGSGGADAAVPPDAGKQDAQPGPDVNDLCGQTCANLQKAYRDAIQTELTCDPTAASQCLAQTQSDLVCGCPIWVNTTVITDAIRKNFMAAGCDKCTQFTLCPAIACIPPKPAQCVPVSAQANPPVDRPIIAPPGEKGQCMVKGL
jgi:hypothetical protein